MAKKMPTFINVDLNGMQRVRYEDLGLKGEEWHFLAEALIEAGLKLGLRADLETGSFSVSITDRLKGSRNKDCTLNAWGSSLEGALNDALIIIGLASERKEGWGEVIEKLRHESKQDVSEYREFLEWKSSQTK